MNRSIRRLARTAGPCLALGTLLALAATEARAQQSVADQTYDLCGKWVTQLRNYGRQKVSDYDALLPSNYQVPEPFEIPRMRIYFYPSGVFEANLLYVTQTGSYTQSDIHDNPATAPPPATVPRSFEMWGTWEQKKRRILFEVFDDPAQYTAAQFIETVDPTKQQTHAILSGEALDLMYAELSRLSLFARRELVADINSVSLLDKKIKLKGKVSKDGETIKIKWRSRLIYAIDTEDVIDPDRLGKPLPKGSIRYKAKGQLEGVDGRCPAIELP